jgi:predicted dehydrogenase
MGDDAKITRREFLKHSAVGAAALGIGALAPASVLGANERLRLGVIGCGGQGTGHLRGLVERAKDPKQNLAVVAVCDIYEPRKQRAKEISGARVFHDYREMLALDDLDAVVIGSPDHWHAQMSMDAMLAGKDVYCEKPMTLYWREAKRVAETAALTGRVFQVGAQSCSEDRYWKARDLIARGAVGKLVWTQSSYSRNSRDGEWNWSIDAGASPANLDWQRWLGPAPPRAFDPERYFRFRKYWDYSGGIATDLFYHQLAHLEVALGPEFPRRVVAGGGTFVFQDREVPDTFHLLVDYPSGHTVTLLASMANEQGVPEVIRGHEATLTFEGPGVVVRPEHAYQAERTELRVAAKPRPGHMDNFLQCVRTRERPACDAQTGYRVMVAIALGVLAYRQGKAMMFDPEREELVA